MNSMTALAGYVKKHTLGQNFVRRNPLYYAQACAGFAEMERLDLPGRRAWARERLAQTLALARGTDYGHSVQGGDDLASWPLLDKEPLRNGLRSFIAGTEWMAAPATTGGTSGVPLRVLRSLQSIVFEQATIDRVTELAGADGRRVRVAVMRGDNPRDLELSPNPDCEYIDGGRILTMSANAVTHVSADFIAGRLEEFSPQLLCAYPTALETLCRHLRRKDRRLSIPVVVTSSEVFRADAWKLCEERLGARIADYYGQAERVAFAYALAPREYRFAAAYAFVEFIPHEGLLPPGDSRYRLYEIVGTTYWNGVLPLVRYRTGDLIRLPAAWGAAELEELALGLRTFEGVLGRQQEIIVCPQPVRLSGIGSLPRDLENVLRLQVVQVDVDQAEIHVLATEGFCAKDADDLLANVRARVPEEVGLTVTVARRLERTPRGKTPLIVHRPAVHDLLRRQGIEPLFTR